MRQGGDPRLPLELALVKVTRPGADLSRESLAYRLEQLESARPRGREPPPETRRRARARAETPAPDSRRPRPEPPPLELEQLQEAWQRSILPAVEERSIPIGVDARRGASGRRSRATR